MRLGSILQYQLKRKGLAVKIDSARIVTALQKIIRRDMPEAVSSRCRVAFIHDRYATINVTDPAVGQEISLYQEGLLEKLREVFPTHKIEVFRWRVRGHI